MDDIVERWLAGKEPSLHEEVRDVWEMEREWEMGYGDDYGWWDEWSVLIYSPEEIDVLILWLSMRVPTGKDQKHLETLYRFWKDSRYRFEGVGSDRYDDPDERSVFVWRCSNKRL